MMRSTRVNRGGAVLLVFPALTLAVVSVGRGDGAVPARKAEWSFARRLYRDPKAFQVGDLLTILIDEQASASKNVKSSSERKSTIGGKASVTHPTLDSQPTPWTNALANSLSLDTSSGFSGSGSVENKDRVSASITARVLEVLPNGNLLIEGQRTVVVQDETLQMVLTGTARPADISRDNTVKSTCLADAVIRYTSNGPTVAAQKRGLLTRLWDWINPF